VAAARHNSHETLFSTVAKKTWFVGSEVLTAVIMKVTVLWSVKPCSSEGARRFGRTYHPQTSGSKNKRNNNSAEASDKLCCLFAWQFLQL
jgi:hypothetical protein